MKHAVNRCRPCARSACFPPIKNLHTPLISKAQTASWWKTTHRLLPRGVVVAQPQIDRADEAAMG